ncbi:MAG: S-layer homology domain-containing protein [Candidatus Ancillula sp.]|jgi:hypothetical protein|nr:S-layer homology domain-containing protein [Candidatus Ancillula sp.]
MKYMVKQKLKNSIIGICCLALVLGVSLLSLTVGVIPNSKLIKANASISGECGSSSDLNYMSSSMPDTDTVSWAGQTWDIIGYNTGSKKLGVANEDGSVPSVTLLLDKSSLDKQYNTVYSSSEDKEYSSSDLKTAIDNYYQNALVGDKSDILARTIKGGSADGDSIDYMGDKVYGSDSSQYLWPLSFSEISLIKSSVRSFHKDSSSYASYWTRSGDLSTPGSTSKNRQMKVGSDGVISYGDLDSASGVRPALYIKLSALSGSLPSLQDKIADNSVKLGACPKTPQITTGDYTWDIIGYNNVSKDGVATGKFGANTESADSATLLLSLDSVKKFEFMQRDGKIYQSGKTIGMYSSYITQSNKYADSDLLKGMNYAYSQASSALSSANLTPLPRTLIGGSDNYTTTGYDENHIAGDSVKDANFWPLSVAEANSMNQQSRFFGESSWLRSPGSDYRSVALLINSSVYLGNIFEASIDLNGTVTKYDDYSLRPAFQTKLTSAVIDKIKEVVNQPGGSEYYDPQGVDVDDESGSGSDSKSGDDSGSGDNPTSGTDDASNTDQITCSSTKHVYGKSCVDNVPTNLSLNEDDVTLTTSEKERQTYQLKSVVKSSQGKLSTEENRIKYISSNSKIAKVSASGKITGLRVGTDIVTIKTINNKIAKCHVVVKLPQKFQYKKDFKDIKRQNSEFQGYIKWMYNFGVTKGTTNSTFSPNNPVRRDQMAMFIFRLIGSPDYSTKHKAFKDVKKADESYKSVMWLVNETVTKGTDSKHYSPKDSVTRMQMALFMYRLAKSNGIDVKTGVTTKNTYHVKDWNKNWDNEYKSAVNWLLKTKVSTQRNTTYWPSKSVTRAQMAAFMNRLYNNVLIK